MSRQNFFASAPKGIEALLAHELRSLGAVGVQAVKAGVAFSGEFETALRVCLWSRLASRVFLPLLQFKVTDPDELYAACYDFPWEEHFRADQTLAVDATLVTATLTHSHYAALKVKDAVVDRFRDRGGERPSVDTLTPDIRLNLHLRKDQATLSLDLSGDSLHRRGYRQERGLAPLKENLAAALLLLAGWPKIAAAGGPLIDPMCGAGTLPLEAALMAADSAPGLLRQRFGFSGWNGHDPDLWQQLVAEAQERRTIGLAKVPRICGFDAAHGAIRYALHNASHCGLDKVVHFEKRPIDSSERLFPLSDASGLVVVNPPYGERLGERTALQPLYRQLGERLKREAPGWKAAVLTSADELGYAVGLRPEAEYPLYNGAIACRLLVMPVPEAVTLVLSPGAEMFANRLRKNLRRLGRWAKRQQIGCYRLYDADMPEYAVAVDLYEGQVHVQEYAPPETIDSFAAAERLREVMEVLPHVLDIPAEKIFLKVRQKQKGSGQYARLDTSGAEVEVQEGPARLLVNLQDYLDTGLFLDHRPVRRLLFEQAAGKRLLNLFCYTGSATVLAALGGAARSVSVDMSKTYIDWARRNFELNGLSPRQHELIQADCLTWLEKTPGEFDLIFLDPPTFSNSKRMATTFDIQRDYIPLLLSASRRLARDGEIIFSTNRRKFRFDSDALPGLTVDNITHQTLDEDFARNPQIHSCFRVRRT